MNNSTIKQFNNKSGFLLVIDGIDGSGKTTQITLLSQYLKDKGIDFEVISFPRYGNNKYTDQIESYLNRNISYDSNSIARAFAGDRLLAKPLIEAWLKKGKLVIANRYASSSKAHLGANIPEDKRETFFKWLEELEYVKNGIPKEDLTILLDIDPKIGQKNVLVKNRPDLHEYNLKHLKEARKIYLNLAKSNPNWMVVKCMEDGKMKSPQQIHQKIVKILERKLFQNRKSPIYV